MPNVDDPKAETATGLAADRTVAAADALGSARTLAAGSEVATLIDPDLDPEALQLPVVSREYYEVLGEHGRGGLGRILRARDRRTGRVVAIKEMLREQPDAARRFAREALITANLQHPAIVPVYEVGRWPTGQPFFAMKLVSGRALSDAIRAAPTAEARLALVGHALDAADALAYAHAQGWIHRDLKPANVLVGDFGETVVIDWGLAKRTGPAPSSDVTTQQGRPRRPGPDDDLTTAEHTAAGAVVGTPAYMPPEQARGEHVDARSDVYALGAMLYHVLAGATPFQDQASAAEVLARVAAGERPRPLAALAPTLPAELVAIVERAMAPEAVERYPTARELAEDLTRFQAGALVLAHRYSAWQLVRRWLRAHRAAVAIAATALVALIVVGALAVTGIVRAERRERAERGQAVMARAEADARRREADDRLVALYRELGRTELVRGQAARALPYLAEAYRHDARDPVLRFLIARGAEALDGLIGRHEAGATLLGVTASAGVAVAATFGDEQRLWDLASGREAGTVRGNLGVVSPVGRLVATTDADVGTVWIRDVATRGDRAQLRPGGVVRAHGFADDDRRYWAGTFEGELRWWRSDTGLEEGRVRCPDKPVRFAADPAGRWLAAGSDGGALWLWRLADRSRVALSPAPAAVRAIAVDDRGETLLTSAPGQAAHVEAWSPTSGRRIAALHLDSSVWAAALAGDGARAAACSKDRGPVVWELPSGRELRRLPGTSCEALALSHDGATLAVADRDGAITLWALASGLSVARFAGHEPRTDLVAFAPGDGILLSASLGGEVRAWRNRPSTHVVSLRHEGRTWYGAFLDDKRVVTVGGDRLGRISAVADGRELAVLRGHGDAVTWVDARGDRIATASRDGTARLWTADGAPVAVLGGHTAKVRTVELDAANRVLTASADGSARLWDAGTGAAGRVFKAPVALMGARFAGRHIIGIAEAPIVPVWDADTGATLAEVPFAGQTGVDAAVSPDGARALVVGHAAEAPLIQTRDGAVLRMISTEVSPLAAAWSADGTRVALSLVDGSVHVLDAAGEPVRRLQLSSEAETAVAYRPDGLLIAASGVDGVVHIVEAATGRALAHLDTGEQVFTLRWSPAGGRLLILGAGEVAYLWDLDHWTAPVAELDGRIRCAVPYRLSGEGLEAAAPDPAACAR